MLMCRYCIEEAKSRGEKVYVGDLEMYFEQSMEDDIPCECCDEYDDLFNVTID